MVFLKQTLLKMTKMWRSMTQALAHVENCAYTSRK